jgi:hypothetical protein
MPELPEARRAPAWAVSLLMLSLSLWLGAVAFFSGGVLPALFLNLEPHEAGRIAALVFPVYFRAGLVLGLLACTAALVLARSQGRKWKIAAGLLVAMTACQAWSALVVHPEMARIRGVDGEAGRFQELHRLSVRLNSVVLGGGLLLLVAGGYLFTVRRDEA